MRFDAAGACPVLVDDDEEILSSPGVRWRFVADVGTRDEGLDFLEELHRQLASSELVTPTHTPK